MTMLDLMTDVSRVMLPDASSDDAEWHAPTTERRWVRFTLIAVALAFLALFLVMPLIAVFIEAFRKGAEEFVMALGEPDTLAAIRLTLTVAAIAVPLNMVFGVAAAWAIAKFEFKGKAFLITLIDLPFSVSPVISGLVYVLLFGSATAISVNRTQRRSVVGACHSASSLDASGSMTRETSVIRSSIVTHTSCGSRPGSG